jgi:hypothetical protein
VNPFWGTKLTGKVGKTTMGFMSAYDETPPEIDNPWEDEPDVTDYRGLVNVFRLKQDLYSESHIGFILIDKEMGHSWKSITHNYNRVAGFDGHFKFWNNYRISFQTVGSQTKWGSEKTGLVPAMSFNFIRLQPDTRGFRGFLGLFPPERHPLPQHPCGVCFPPDERVHRGHPAFAPIQKNL